MVHYDKKLEKEAEDCEKRWIISLTYFQMPSVHLCGNSGLRCQEEGPGLEIEIQKMLASGNIWRYGSG